MHLPNSSSVIPDVRRQVIQILDEIRQTLDLSDKDLSGYMHLTVPELDKVRNGSRRVSIQAICYLSDALNLQLDAFRTGHIDYQALKEHHTGNVSYISEKYSRAAFSKMSTFLVFLEYLERYSGPQVKYSLMRKFQLTNAAVEDPNRRINISFFKDMLAYLSSVGFSSVDFYNIGGYANLF